MAPFVGPFKINFPAREVLFGDPVRGTLPEGPASHFGMLLAALGGALSSLLGALWVLFGCLWPLLAAPRSLWGLL